MLKQRRQDPKSGQSFILAMLATSVIVVTAVAQTGAPHAAKTQEMERRWRMAQDFERNGAIDRAAEMYLALFQEDPRHTGYYQAVARTLTQLRRFDPLIAAIERRIATTGEFTAGADLGEAYYRKGDEAKARAVWQELLVGYPQLATYSAVGAAMVENQLLGEAVALYVQGRRVLNQPAGFVFELANIYAARQEYEAATEEYMRYLAANPRQLQFVQGKISELVSSAEAGRRIAVSMSEALARFPQPLLLQRVLAVVYLEVKDFRHAFEVYKIIERQQATAPGQPHSPGSELFAFAERARKAEALDIAEEAYGLVANDMPNSPFGMPAQYGLAQTLHRRGRYHDALQAFQKVRLRQPRSPWAMRSWLQEGEIYYGNLREIDKAIAAFTEVYEKYTGEPERTDAVFRLGDCFVALNNMARAAEWYEHARQRPAPLAQDKATYRLARLEFYQGRFRRAQKLLDAIPSSPESGSGAESMVNDALEMQLLIDAHLADSSGALLVFARAELAAAQGRPQAAVDTLHNLLAAFPSSALSPLALFSVGLRCEETANYQQSVQAYQRLLQDHPADMRADRALVRIAEIAEHRLRDSRMAMAAYERLLSDYANSLFLEQARQQLRRLSEKPAPVIN